MLCDMTTITYHFMRCNWHQWFIITISHRWLLTTVKTRPHMRGSWDLHVDEERCRRNIQWKTKSIGWTFGTLKLGRFFGMATTSTSYPCLCLKFYSKPRGMTWSKPDADPKDPGNEMYIKVRPCKKWHLRFCFKRVTDTSTTFLRS